MEFYYSHRKYGDGTWLIDKDFNIVAKLLKTVHFPEELNQPISDFPGMEVRTRSDYGRSPQPGIRYHLRWETLGVNLERFGNERTAFVAFDDLASFKNPHRRNPIGKFGTGK